MAPQNTAKIEEIDEATDEIVIKEYEGSDSSGDEAEQEQEHDAAESTNGVDSPGASSSAQSKKKRKKKAKIAKIFDAMKPGSKEIPQALVDSVMEKVREEHGEGAPGTDEETVRKALEQLKVMDVIKGKAGIGGKGKKDTGGHKARTVFVCNDSDAYLMIVLGDTTCTATR